MATTLDPRDRAVVNYEEPPIKPPPVLAVGPLAWMRENLFKSTFDTILTFVSLLALIGLIVSLFQWAISQANWLVITNNLRLFMVGTMPPDTVWRINWAARFCAFVVGVTVMAYTRVSRPLLIGIGVVLALLFVVPLIVRATVPPATAYVAAGSTSIVSGTVSEKPQPQVAFIGQAGDAISIAYAEVNNDRALAQIAGFDDRAANALVNSAHNRLDDEQERVELQYRLDHALLTDVQRQDLTTQLNSLTIPDPVTDTYQLNQTSTAVAILDGATQETLASATLDPSSPPLTFALPHDGWYILQKTTTDDSGAALLATTGIYPLHEVDFTRSAPGGGSQSIAQFVRLTDGYTTEALRPTADGQPIPMKVITDNQFLGARSFGDYLYLYVAPFFNSLSFASLQLVLLGVLGYAAGIGLMRILPPVSQAPAERGDQRKRVRGTVTWLWVIWLIALFVLAYGIAGLDAIGVGLLISRFVWVGWMYFTGMNLDRAWGRSLLALVTLIGLIQSVIGDGILDKLKSGDPGALIIPVISTVIWLLVGLTAARMGRGQADRWRDPLRLRALVIAAVAWLILLVAPPLLLNAAGTTQDVLPVADTRRWGGFLLTALLTIVGILASFPLGVLLALGRRSTLPVVRWTSIFYIELVRGVPLITILFMAQLLVPLVNPALVNVDNVFRAMVGITLFSAAYLAENVRGGLQAIPHGQEEAAKALGLNSYQITLFILLPQALRIVIPALVGQAIALFKDTSLVALVGLIDLTGIAQTVISQTEYLGLQREVYLFIAIIYFVFSYLMAWISRRIEASGSGAARQV